MTTTTTITKALGLLTGAALVGGLLANALAGAVTEALGPIM